MSGSGRSASAGADLAAPGLAVAFVDGAAIARNGIEPNLPGSFISAVKHTTFVEVNAARTKAAAGTKAGVEVTSVPPNFTLNGPFAPGIRE